MLSWSMRIPAQGAYDYGLPQGSHRGETMGRAGRGGFAGLHIEKRSAQGADGRHFQQCERVQPRLWGQWDATRHKHDEFLVG